MHISEDGKYFVTGRYHQYLFTYRVISESFFCHMADVTITTGGTINNINRSIYNGAEMRNLQNSWINVCSPGLNKHLQNSNWSQHLFLNEFHSLSWCGANLTFLFLVYVHADFCGYNAKHQISLSGGDDKLLKLWHYSDGEVTHVGVGHSGSITNVRICPNSKCIVSTSADGAILRWSLPTNPKQWIRISNAVQIW